MNLENCKYFSLWHAPPPLTARKRTAVGRLPTAKNSGTAGSFSVACSSIAVLFRAVKGTAAPAVAAPGPPARKLGTAGVSAALGSEDRLLSQIDQKLPFARHIVRALEHFDLIQDFIVAVFVRP